VPVYIAFETHWQPVYNVHWHKIYTGTTFYTGCHCILILKHTGSQCAKYTGTKTHTGTKHHLHWHNILHWLPVYNNFETHWQAVYKVHWHKNVL